MALDFPNAPVNGQTFQGWMWDGVKWTVGPGQQGSFLPISGGTLTGPLVLSGNATASLNPVTLQQATATYLPLAGGTMSGPLVLSGPPTAPNQAATMSWVNTQNSAYLPLSGGTMSGALVLATDPVASLGAATKQYVDNSTGVTPVGDTAPASPKNGSLWYDSVSTQLFLWYQDPTSAQWVPANSMTGGPYATTTYVDSGDATVLAKMANNVGRNLVHNPVFSVAQRGAGPFSATGYSLDRWSWGVSLDTSSITQTAATDAMRSAIGDDSAAYVASFSVTGNAGAGAYSNFRQPIEDVRRLGNKTVIVSFWAATNVASSKIGVSLDQAFGSGGSPSAAVFGNGQAVTTPGGSTYTRYSLVFTTPTIQGKTLGTNNDHYTLLNFWFSSGATQNVRAGNIGVQTFAPVIYGIQLEIAQPGQTQPTPLDKGGTPQQQLAECQRFYTISYADFIGYGGAGSSFAATVYFPVTMRAGPTIAFSGTTLYNLPSISAVGVAPQYVVVSGAATATAVSGFVTSLSVSADL